MTSNAMSLTKGNGWPIKPTPLLIVRETANRAGERFASPQMGVQAIWNVTRPILPSLLRLISIVFVSRPEFKILWTIILSVFVDVVNHFSAKKRAPQQFFHDMAVLINVVFPNPNSDVSVGHKMPTPFPSAMLWTYDLRGENTFALSRAGLRRAFHSWAFELNTACLTNVFHRLHLHLVYKLIITLGQAQYNRRIALPGHGTTCPGDALDAWVMGN